MLIAHANALEAVDGEDFLQKVFLYGLDAKDAEQVMGIDGAFGQLIVASTWSPTFTFRREP